LTNVNIAHGGAEHGAPADRFAQDRAHFSPFWCRALATADVQAVGRCVMYQNELCFATFIHHAQIPVQYASFFCYLAGEAMGKDG
jgi:hypothetical protein